MYDFMIPKHSQFNPVIHFTTTNSWPSKMSVITILYGELWRPLTNLRPILLEAQNLLLITIWNSWSKKMQTNHSCSDQWWYHIFKCAAKRPTHYSIKYKLEKLSVFLRIKPVKHIQIMEIKTFKREVIRLWYKELG